MEFTHHVDSGEMEFTSLTRLWEIGLTKTTVDCGRWGSPHPW